MWHLRRQVFVVGLALLVLGDGPWLAAADQEPTYQGKSLPVWVAALKHKDPRVRFDAAFALSKVGVPKELLALLITAVKDEDPAIRSLAIETLSRTTVEDSAIVAALLGALKDNQVLVRVDAETALGKLPLPILRAGLQPLKAALQDKNPAIRRVAGAALKRQGPETSALVKDITALKDTYWPNRYRAAQNLGKLGEAAKEVVPVLREALKDKEWNVRVAAAEALGNIGPVASDAVAALIETLRDPEELVREAAGRALGRIGPAASDAVAALSETLKDPKERVREAAVRALGRIGPAAREAVPDVRTALKDRAMPVREAAGWALGEIVLSPVGEATGIVSALKSASGPVAFSPDGRRMITGVPDSLAVYNTATGKQLCRLKESRGTGCIAFSPDGRRIVGTGPLPEVYHKFGESFPNWPPRDVSVPRPWNAATSPPGFSGWPPRDVSVRVWEASTGEVLLALRGQGLTSCIAYSADGRLFASGGWDGTVVLWEAHTGKKMLTLRGHSNLVRNLAFSRDGKYLASRDGKYVSPVSAVSVASKSMLKPADYYLKDSLTNHTWGLPFSDQPQAMKLWDAATGKEMSFANPHRAPVTCIATSPDGRGFYTASCDGTVRLWDPATGKTLLSLDAGAYLVALAVSADSKSVAACRNACRSPDDWGDRPAIIVWDVRTGKRQRVLRTWADSVTFSPDGKHLVPCDREILKAIDLTKGASEDERTQDLDEGVVRLAFDASGKELTIVSVGEKRLTGKKWLAVDRRHLSTGRTHRTMRLDERLSLVALDGHGTVLATAGAKDKNVEIKLWDPVTGKARGLFVGPHLENVNSLAFSRDGKNLAADSHGIVDAWVLTAGRIKRETWLWDVTRGVRSRILPTGVSFDLAFSPEGKPLTDRDLWTWDMPIGQSQYGFTSPMTALVVALHPDGKFFAASFGDYEKWKSGRVELREIATGRKKQVFQGHEGLVLSLAFSPDGKLLASGGDDQKVILWDVASGKALHHIDSLGDDVRAIAFSPDGKTLAAAGDYVRIWAVATLLAAGKK